MPGTICIQISNGQIDSRIGDLKEVNNMRSRFPRKGFTLIEIIIAIALLGLVVSAAGMFLGFSLKAQKLTSREAAIQAEVRKTSETLNNSIRVASVTFTVPESIFLSSKKEKWNYFGIENHTDIVQYIWNETTGLHDRRVLLTAGDGVLYNLYFDQSVTNTKLIQFNLDCFFDGSSEAKLKINTELEAINSVAVVDGGSTFNPSVAIAYRTDDRPLPESVTTNNTVHVAVAMVLDDSGSMDFDLNGKQPGDWGFDRNNVRKDIVREKAKALVDQFAGMGNVEVSIIPFANDADSHTPFYSLDNQTNVSIVKTKLNSLDGYGGTNTGDGLRRAYHLLYDHSRDPSKPETVYYIIALTDGNPTYYSWKNGAYQKDSADCYDVRGTGNSDPSDYCINYAKYIGSNLISSGVIDISTYVIGFTNVPTEVSKANQIAASALGTYFAATSAIELEQVFESITTTILHETWHIYGPY